MNMLDTNLDYNEFNFLQKELYFIFKSKVRLGILKKLYRSPLTKKEIKSGSNYSYTTINHDLNKLKRKGYVVENEGLFSLSEDFKTTFNNLLNLDRAVNFVEANKSFLNNHRIFNINSSSLMDISPLQDMELIVNDNADIFKVSRLIKDFFMDCGTIKSIFPYVPLNFDEVFDCWLKNEVDVDLILSKGVCQFLKNFICEYDFEMDAGDFSFDVKAAEPFLDVLLIATDKGILLGFYNSEGSFDRNRIFLSKSRQAIEWGYEVFEANSPLCDEHFSLDELLDQERGVIE